MHELSQAVHGKGKIRYKWYQVHLSATLIVQWVFSIMQTCTCFRLHWKTKQLTNSTQILWCIIDHEYFKESIWTSLSISCLILKTELYFFVLILSSLEDINKMLFHMRKLVHVMEIRNADDNNMSKGEWVQRGKVEDS